MAGYDYSKGHSNSGYFIPPDETELQPLGSPWSPDLNRGHRSHGSLSAPLMDAGRAFFGDLQTRMTMMGEKEMEGLQSYHSGRKQLYKLMGRMLVRFIVSLAFCSGIVALFVYYEKTGVLNSNEKHLFNAIFIGLSMLLSMNLISSFKSLASIMRWRILANNEHSLREVDLILALSSFQKTLELLWIPATKPDSGVVLNAKQRTAATKRWSFRLGAACWILLGLAAQIDVALIGLTYNHDSEGAVDDRPGQVEIADLSGIYAEFDSEGTIPVAGQKYAAHLYGKMSTNIATKYLSGKAEADAAPDNETIILDVESNVFYYYFREWAKCDICAQVPHRTNRSVEIVPHCRFYDVPADQLGTKASPISIVTEEGNTTIDWLQGTGPDMTIMINPEWRWNDELLSPEYIYCGPRCNYVYVFQFFSNNVGGSFFNCTVDIGEVLNASIDLHELPGGIASIIAGAAGSEGWKDDLGRQYVKYGVGNYWGADNGKGEGGERITAQTIGKFACGVLYAYDAFGARKLLAPGMQAWVGVRLVVKWTQLYICLGMILAIQLIFGIFIVFKANVVYCKDESYLSTARLLRPLLERLGPSGSHCDGKKIASTFHRKVVYGVRTNEDQNIHHLDFGENIDVLAHGKKFPDGKYD